MNEQIKCYVDGIFSKVQSSQSVQELKEELTANLTEKYNDLIAQGKSPETAYCEATQSAGDASDYGFAPKWESAQEQAQFSTMDVVREVTLRESVNNIELHWCIGGAQILKSSDDTIRIVQKAKRGLPGASMFSYDVFGDTLTVRDNNFGLRRGWPLRWIIPTITYLELYLPQRIYKTVKARSLSGFIKGDALQAQQLITQNMSGSIRMYGSFQDIKCKNSSGLTLINTSEKATVEATNAAGKINLYGAIAKLDIHNSSGHVKADSSVCCEIRVQCSAGKVAAHGDFSSADVSTSSGKVYLDSGKMLERLNMHITSGSSEIRMPEQPEGFCLEVKKLSGFMQCDFPMRGQCFGEGRYSYDVQIFSGVFRLLRNG